MDKETAYPHLQGLYNALNERQVGVDWMNKGFMCPCALLSASKAILNWYPLKYKIFILPERLPDMAASNVDTWNSLRASSTCAAVAKGSNLILASDSEILMIASSCLKDN